MKLRTHLVLSTFAAPALLLATAPAARAQVRIVSIAPGQEIIFDGEDEMSLQEMPVAPSGVPVEAKKAPGPRLEKLKKLDFDRRASAILAAWSTPPKKAGESGDAGGTGATTPDASGEKTGKAQGNVVDRSAATGGMLVAARAVPAQPAGATPVAVTSTGTLAQGTPAQPATAPSTAAQPGAAQPTAGQPTAAQPTGSQAAAAPPTAAQAGAEQPATPAEATPVDPEAAAKAAAEAKKKAEEEAAKKAAEAKALEEELAAFQRNVTLGEWESVKTYLASLTDEEKKVAYDRLLSSLRKGPERKPEVPPQGQPYLEKNLFSAEDVLALVHAAPIKISRENLALLGQILRQSLDQGQQMEGFLALVRPHLLPEATVAPSEKAAESPAADPATAEPSPSGKTAAEKPVEPPLAGGAVSKRQLCLVLSAANEQLFLGEFLPTAEEAEAKSDREALNLISRHCLAKFDKEKKTSWLEQAWRATQAVLAVGEVSEDDKKEALTRAVDIAPKIQKELGQAWLDESFTARPERGMEILTAIGTSASTALQMSPQDADRRFKLLELQTTAAKALLAAAPERATEWKQKLEVLGTNWLREALVTHQYDDSTSLGPKMQRDNYGNFYYWDGGQQYRGQGPKPIRTSQVLEIRPTDEWLARVDAPLLPRFHMIFAQLLLKVSEEERAFPYIEKLAATHPRQAKDLVDEFLRVWAKNHDPNSDRNRTNQYIFFYGFEERAAGIPLTRSKQDRNLKELGEWVGRVRALDVEVEPALLANAFVAAHSTAEVYRLETIEQIFGPLSDMKPATLAQLVEKMRANLATVWRDPALQKDKKTNRRQQDIQAEVLRGYQLARSTVETALARHDASWELWLVKAAIEHDENDFRHEISKDPGFSAARLAAFETFHKAAELYAREVTELEQEKETTRVHEMWFYAALGACDLKAVDNESQLAAQEIPLIKAAIEGLPGERAKRHMGMFANALTTRTQNAAPAVKFRYVREGLAIAGDDPMAHEVRAVFDYYSDLVTEIQLVATVDGSARIGNGKPFGLRVDIRHTKEIERESGGFGKYLQNQNQASFGYNYGRPLEDYRDKFEEAARAALREHFEVLSVTFNDPQVRSKAEPEYGWRRTPYAYLLMKARGPQVDRVPPLQLDLDFLDTSGYAVVPVTSPPVIVDAKDEVGDERPYTKLALTQMLDERQAKEGKLLLEIKATALGLVPDLESIVDLETDDAGSGAGFDVAKTDDQGVSVTKFDDDGVALLSERTWTVTLRAKPGQAKLPDSFTFASAKVDTASDERFRYVDADLEAVGPTVKLEHQYGKPRSSRLWLWIPLGLVLAGGAFVAFRLASRPKARADKRFRMPDPVTPFTVLGLLRDIESKNGLKTEEKREIDVEIAELELYFFGDEAAAGGRSGGGSTAETPDLERIAARWVARTA
jgi:hypothetical protein